MTGGAVASGHPEVSAAARVALEAGGNAFDAAVAAGFASAVAEPALTSLGGGGFLLAHTPTEDVLFDFFVDTPGHGLPAEALARPHFEPVTIHFKGASQLFNIGLGSVATPGSVEGLLHVHRRLGRLPLAEVTAPAIRLAREGLVLEPLQAYTFQLLQPILCAIPEGQRLFSDDDGKPRAAGTRYAVPETADFLENLPEAARSLYGGALAEEVDAQMRAGGGLLTRRDLAGYQVVERKPLRHTYRGHTVLSNPLPALGGPMITLMLALLEHVEVGSGRWLGPVHLLKLASVMREAEQLRARGIYTLSDLQAQGGEASLERLRVATRGTTHLTVADDEGNVATMTTSNGEGSGHFLPGTGIMLNNMLGEDDLHPGGFHQDPPGQRVASMMAPTIVLDEHGALKVALGSGGSKRIRTALVQVISHVVDHGKDLAEAVLAPRVHFEGEALQVEGGHDEEALEHLRERGFRVNAWEGRDLYFGGVHAVAPAGPGADPRRGGVGLRVGG